MVAFAPPSPIGNHPRSTSTRRHAPVVALDPAILTIDVGTSATKAGLYYPGTRTLGPAFRHAYHAKTQNGLTTQQKQDWLDAAIASSRQAISQDSEIIAVSITGQMQDVIAVGDTPPLLTSDAVLYSTRVPDHAARLSKLANIDLSATSIPAKLALLSPGNYRLLFGAADFLSYSFCSEQPIVTDATTVSTTSLTSAPHRFYDTELLTATQQGAFRALLPEILRSPQQVGTVSPEIASVIHAGLSGIPVIHAGGDAHTATIGAGGDYVYGGTSGWVGRVLPRTARRPHGVLTLAHARDAELIIAAGSVADVGGCMAHTGGLMGCTPREVGDLARCGRGGVVYVPYLSGRRCPPGAGSGAWVGLKAEDGRAEMARGVVEGVVFGLFAAGGGLGVGDVSVVGGMMECEVFIEGVAALFGRCAVGERDVGMLGAGLVAAEVLGITGEGEKNIKWVKVDEGVREQWRQRYEKWQSVVAALDRV